DYYCQSYDSSSNMLF
nr:immunoglobulin light chain junction region [Macaca mulatta]MOX29569.1 immunoglobulin light chain junction region [Macaca mulatta]MOX30436.1 immunoglobulin light chain junction region [Macaca mulatta]MOX30613.1 immunoglobulin light chain junction region [Macaca mulatta]MOX30949.1 immunoglobulin light chain junction region [Macaca mulatta]